MSVGLAVGGVVALAALAWWWRGSAEPPVAPVTARGYRDAVCAELDAVGVRVAGGDLDVLRLPSGRQLPLRPHRDTYARAHPDDRPAVLRRTVEGWSMLGHILTLDDYRERVVRAMREAGLTPTVDDDALVRNELGALVLEPGFRRAQAMPPLVWNDAIADLIRQMRLAGDVPASWEAIEDLVMPRVRHHPWDATDEGPRAWIAPGLALEVTLPREQVHLRVDAHLEAWGGDPADALARAFDNLLATQEVHPFVPHPTALHARASAYGDYRDALVLVLPEDGMASLGLPGRPVAFVVTEALVLLAGAEDEDGLWAGVQACLACVSSGTPTLYAGPLVRADDGEHWEPFVPPEDHPLSAHMIWLHAVVSAAEAERMGAVLDEDAVLPRAQIRFGEPGGRAGACVWLPRACLLPDTVWTVVVSPDGEGVIAPTELVLRLAGEAVQPIDGFPLWRTASGPFPASRWPELVASGDPIGPDEVDAEARGVWLGLRAG